MPDTSPAGRLTIGGVLARLKPDFPDVSISKIRFLEAEGLISPGRTASGYRVYDEKDLERLRYILTAQRERFWPLKVIRDALDAMDRGLEAPPPQQTRAHVPAVPADADVPASEYFHPDLATLRLTAASRPCA